MATLVINRCFWSCQFLVISALLYLFIYLLRIAQLSVHGGGTPVGSVFLLFVVTDSVAWCVACAQWVRCSWAAVCSRVCMKAWDVPWTPPSPPASHVLATRVGVSGQLPQRWEKTKLCAFSNKHGAIGKGGLEWDISSTIDDLPS